MESDREIIELELKYCERCGGLWLRRKGNVEVYCAPCSGKVGARVTGVSRPRLPVNRCIEMPVRHESENGRGGEA